LRYARQFGWRFYHTLNSWGSAKGFPDLVLVRPPRLLFVELKSDKGKVKPEQIEWLADLRASKAEAYLWRPMDVEAVVAILAQVGVR
jgi:Holliday junction resolvase